MIIPIYDLSPELVNSILEFLPTQYLKTASLVCRKWYIISAPLLYHAIKIAGEQCAVDFVRLVLDKLDVGEGQSKRVDNVTLYFVTSVRRLHICPVREDEEIGHGYLEDAISKLTSLEHLHWDAGLLDSQGHRVASLPKNLSGLRSLSLLLNNGNFLVRDPDDDKGLTNLRELSVQFHRYQTRGWDRGPAQLLLDVTRGALNLESLSVGFLVEDDPDLSSSFYFSVLSRRHFPELRQFRSCSYHLVQGFGSDKSILRQFLQSHTRLHTIMIEPSLYIGFRGASEPKIPIIAPEDITELMPAVRHFAGPCYLVEALLGSILVDQLEELTLTTESRTTRQGYFEGLFPLLETSDSILPHLKRLRIKSASTRWNDVFIFLAQFAWRVPELEDLDVRSQNMRRHDPDVLDCCLQALNCFPHLRTLSLNDSPFAAVEENTSESNMRFFMGIADICPLLETVHFLVNGEWCGCWEIVRQRGRPVDVVYTQRHRFSDPYGWKGSIYRTISKPPVTRWHLHMEPLE